MIREFTQFAKENDLLVTGGSDYHSDNRELWGNMPSLGMADEEVRPGRELVDNLNLLIASRATIAEQLTQINIYCELAGRNRYKVQQGEHLFPYYFPEKAEVVRTTFYGEFLQINTSLVLVRGCAHFFH